MRLALALLASLGLPSFGALVQDVRAAVSQNQFAIGERMVDEYKRRIGVNSELIDAVSWLGRGAASAKRWTEADRYAKEAYRLSAGQLTKQDGKLDLEPHLPNALGAAIEVEGLVLAAQGQRDQAVAYLQSQLRMYRATSIGLRIQKNINLLSLEGKPLPPLAMTELVPGSPRPPAVQGKPALVFFWAHWCGDCKAEVPVLAQLKREYGPRGVVFLMPTQRYGYAAGGEDATPAAELKYIGEVRQRFYGELLDVSSPVSEENFKRFGCSSTPTIVLADRTGVVRTYHPGAMTEPELRAALDAVLRR